MSVNFYFFMTAFILLSACDSRGPCEGRGTSCTGEALCEGAKSYYFAAVDETGCVKGEAKKYEVNNVPGSQAQARTCAEQEMGSSVMALPDDTIPSEKRCN